MTVIELEKLYVESNNYDEPVKAKTWENCYFTRNGRAYYGDTRFNTRNAAEDFGNNVVLAAEPEHIFIFERHNKELRRREISYFIPLPVKE